MCSFKLICFIIFLSNAYKTNGLISNKRLCVNEDCSEPISLAKTLLRYSSPEASVLSFQSNKNIKIFSKEAGSRLDLWGVEINGKRGYVPKNLVREYKVLAKPTKIVDTELLKEPEVPAGKLPEEKVDPDKVKQPYEVIEGTTIHLDIDNILPSTTESPVLSTVTNSFNNLETPRSTEAKEADSNLEKQRISEENTNVDKQDVDVKTKDSSDGNIFSTIKDGGASEGDEDSEEDYDDDDEDYDDEEEGNEFSEEPSIVDVNKEKDKTDDFTITSNENLIENEDINDISRDNTNETDNSTKTSNENMVENKEANDISTGKAITHNENLKEIINDISKQTESETTEPTTDQKILEDINNSNEKEGNPKKSEEITPQINTPESILQETPEIQTKAEDNVANISKTDNVADISKTDNVVDISERDNVEVIQTVQNNSNAATEVKETFNHDKFDSLNTPEVKEVKVEEKSENIETTTLPSIDNDEVPPLLHVEEVTVNPIETEKPEGNSFASEELSDKKPEIINNINPDYQDGYLDKKSTVDTNLPLHTDTKSTVDTSLPVHTDTKYPPVEKDFEKLKENLFGNHANLLEEKLVDSESNLEENTTGSSISAEVKENDGDLGSSEVKMEADPELPLQEIQQADLKPSEIPPPNSWYGNANTNIDTSSEIKDNNEIPHNVQQKYDIPSDIQINSLKNNEGILPNNLLGENEDEGVLIEETVLKVDSGGFFASLFSFFEKDTTTNDPNVDSSHSTPIADADKFLHENDQHSIHTTADEGYFLEKQENCDSMENSTMLDQLGFLINSDVLIYLVTTAVSCIIFLFVYMLIDKSSREAPLIKKINNLEKELLISLKEKDILQEGALDLSNIPTEEVEQLKHRLKETEILKQNLEMQVLNLEQEIEIKQELEEQIESLERELETSTEVGMELNRIISEMLNTNNGGEKLKENVEQLQRQLSEQKWIINDITKSLSDKATENAELHVQLDESKQKSRELQKKLDEIVDQILKIEKERDQQQKSFQEEISIYQQKYSDGILKEDMLNTEVQILKTQLADAKRKVELKIKEYQSLKESLNGIKSIKNDKEAIQSLLNATTLKAELEQLKSENENYSAQLKQEEAAKIAFENKYQAVIEENNSLLNKYQESDKLKLEANMKLEVLNNYFKKREQELQSEILKYKSIWDAKEGEATSTTERIKLMAEEIENYKSQNETLKQEIVSQEIDLKSQITILEKKVHENWVTSRQMERKLEDAKQEAGQLRNRLTLRERSLIDERLQNRLQSPIDQNGEITLSPPPIESPTSPLLFGGRDHITKSPPLPVLPPFLPPPPGAPFMPPPLHGMPFMPPPPAMFPGDHRPPPLGRMSSPPPMNSRYSPDTSAFSPYDRNSPSPLYDSEYGASPPPISGYNPYNSRDDRREYKRPMHVSNGRNNKGSLMSSGSEHSNDSLDKMNRKHSSKLV